MPVDDHLHVEDRVQASLRSGDLRGAATQAIQGFGPSVAGYLRAMMRDDDDIADAFSDWAESLWRGIGSFEGRSSFRTWTFRLAFTSMLRICCSTRRKRERRLATGEASAIAAEVRTTALTGERRRRGLEELRAELTPDEQTLLFLRAEQGLRWDDVAAVLAADTTSVNAVAVRKRFQRLTAKLRKLARARGLVQRSRSSPGRRGGVASGEHGGAGEAQPRTRRRRRSDGDRTDGP